VPGVVSEPPRPRRLAVVAGTATGVGKTFVAARLAGALRTRGVRVAARKPAQSFAPSEGGPTDAEVLGAATGERAEQVCRRARWYERAMAPPMAAESLGRPAFTIADLACEVAASWPRPAADLGLVELAGGPRSPLAADGDGVDLARALAPDLVLIVADAGLGTLNAARLSADVFAPGPRLLYLNRYDAADELHRRNRAWLEQRLALPLAVEIAALAQEVDARLAFFCADCGRERAQCPGGCARPLDPPRFCPRCGRKLVVQIAPTGQRAECREHGLFAR
jgi:dethiobiotin synthetase